MSPSRKAGKAAKKSAKKTAKPETEDTQASSTPQTKPPGAEGTTGTARAAGGAVLDPDAKGELAKSPNATVKAGARKDSKPWKADYASIDRFDHDTLDEGVKLDPAVSQQVQAARSAARSIIESRVLGPRDAKNFSVEISGDGRHSITLTVTDKSQPVMETVQESPLGMAIPGEDPKASRRDSMALSTPMEVAEKADMPEVNPPRDTVSLPNKRETVDAARDKATDERIAKFDAENVESGKRAEARKARVAKQPTARKAAAKKSGTVRKSGRKTAA